MLVFVSELTHTTSSLYKADISHEGETSKIVSKCTHLCKLSFLRHLTKLFDSIAGLKFAEEESGEGTTAVGMKAKDGEYVEFSNVTKCVGPVCVDSFVA